VTDFVKVESWVGTEGGDEYKYSATDDYSKEFKDNRSIVLHEGGLLNSF